MTLAEGLALGVAIVIGVLMIELGTAHSVAATDGRQLS